MSIYAGRDNDGSIVVDVEPGTVVRVNQGDEARPHEWRARLSPREAEKLGHDLLALAYDHEANRAAYGDASDTEDHDRAVDDALADAQEVKIYPGVDDEYVDPALYDDNHPENDASGEPDFGGNG